MNRKFILILFMLFIFLNSFSSVIAISPEYNIVLKESGEAIILIEMDEKGTYDFSVPMDASVEGKGIIFLRNESQISAYSGSSKKGLFGYSTNSYTIKIKDVWGFEMQFPQKISKITVVLPDSVYIKSANPDPIIHNNQLTFTDTDKININYFYNTKPQFSFSNNIDLFIYALLIIIATILVFVFIKFLRKPKEESAKQNILKTLPHNERKILEYLIEAKGEMKRNFLEKKSKISKSSLANSLNNLEKKNIIEIDKTFVVHTVKLTEWFSRL